MILFLMTYTPLLLYFCAQRFNVSPLAQKIIEVAGNMTYSIYLLHFPLQIFIAVCYLIISKDIPYHSEMFFNGYIIATLVVSYYTYKLIELPAQNYLRKKMLRK
jgi:peptidoglycan/LPS O-acetylase OafA/YrhL